MRTTVLTFTLLVASAAACARTSADRGAARHDDVRSDVPVQPTRVDQGERPGDRAPIPTRLEVTGVHLAPEIADVCGIPLPPTSYFEFDAAAVEAGDNLILRHLANCMTSGPLYGRQIELVGHSDPRGDDDYDRQLGRSRVESLREFLTSVGASPANILTDPMGEPPEGPAYSSDWPHHRRVEIRLLSP